MTRLTLTTYLQPLSTLISLTRSVLVDNTVSGTQVARESIKHAKLGGEGKSYSQMLTDSMVEQIARGDKNIKEYLVEDR